LTDIEKQRENRQGILQVIYDASHGREATNVPAAGVQERLGLPDSEMQGALEYLQEEGLIKVSTETVRFREHTRQCVHLTHKGVKETERSLQARREGAQDSLTADSQIFISYRREDTEQMADRLFESLTAHFGEDQVFEDVDSIQPGHDFAEVIASEVGSCAILLALIGARWLSATDNEGRRRLDNPEDFVRLEIETALARDIRVIPILVQEARLPGADELPPSLANLVRRQALELNSRRFKLDIERLLKVLDGILAEMPAPQFQVVNLPERSVVRDEDLPLTIEGNYAGNMGAAVRVILEDSYRQYYVQNPEVEFSSDGTWHATNIRPGDGTMYVHFVKLNDAAKRVFDQMVNRHAFGAFREMPARSQILQSVTIDRIT
jgi:hypothetical protein